MTKTRAYKNLLTVMFKIFVYCFFSIVFCPVVFAADATLYVSPITGTYTIGTMIPLRVMVSSGGEPVNAVEGKLTYDPKEIEVIDATKDDSVLSSWTVPPTYNNDEGILSFGGLLSTSTILDRGLVVSFTVRAKRSGDVRIHFATGAAVYAADGTGGNLLSTLNGGVYAIIPKEGIPEGTLPAQKEYEASTTVAQLTASNDEVPGEVLGAATGTLLASPTHPDQTLWYALATSTITWDMPGDVLRVRLALDKKPEGEGVVSYGAPRREKMLTNLDEGVWYVHVTREFFDGHSDTSHYQLHIDMTPPTNVTVIEKQRENNTNPNTIFLFSATDTVSGVDHYVVTLDGDAPVSWVPNGAYEYPVQSLKVGAHQLTVSAVDKAGNKSADTSINFSVEYLETPQLVLNTKKISEGGHPTISVSSLPNVIMSVNMQGGGKTMSEEFSVDATGKGLFTPKAAFLPGTYEVWGIARSGQGALSRESAHLTMEVRPSLIGVVKRHPFIPLAVIGLFVFLFVMRMILNKLRSGSESFVGDDDTVGGEERVIDAMSHPLPETHVANSGVVVLGGAKLKQKDRSPHSLNITT